MAKLIVNCSCKEGTFNKARFETLDGRKHVVVPVVMAIEDVVMNGALLPSEEYFAPSWNGVPVTVGHPTNGDGSFLSANHPGSIEDWVVGRIFNSEVNAGKLVGEIWVDVAKANKVSPGLSYDLEAESPMDVSTGFWSDAEMAAGTLNGRSYEYIHRNVRPDHLALLPDEVGACSWKDGCGVRANEKRSGLMAKISLTGVRDLVRRKPKANQATESHKTMVQSLIDDETTPFSVSDSQHLLAMSEETVKQLYGKFVPEEEPEEKEDPSQDVPEEDNEKDKEKDAEMNAAEIKALVDNAVKEAVTAATAAFATNAAKPALSAEDIAALNHAKQIVANEKTLLVNHVVANSTMKAEFLNGLDMATLKQIAEGLAPVVHSYGGRPLPSDGDATEEAIVNAMTPIGVVAAINSKKKKEA